MSESSLTTRRRFLHVLAAASGAGATVMLGCSGPGGSGGPSGTIPAGNISDLPVGTLKAVPSESVAIGRDQGGVYAMTLICPHASCDMESRGTVSASGVTCNCHGSAFDANGTVLQGPAHTNLEHFEVTIDSSGNITINADNTVGASVRTAA